MSIFRKANDAKPEAITLPNTPASPPDQPDFLGNQPPPEFLRHSLDEQPTATPQETKMARSPFAPPMPPNAPMRPAHIPAPPTAAAPSTYTEPADRRTLVVGRGISVQGTVQDAERLVVEGTMEATMINGLIELIIPHGGVFKGEVEVDEAEVAGTVDGTLTARNTLIVRATGRVLGVARCRRLQVEDGGQITGRIEMLNTAAPTPAAPDVFVLGEGTHGK